MEMEHLIGQTVAHYQVHTLLKRGEVSAVFLAQDVHLRRQVELLVYRLAEDQRNIFLQQARTLAQLDHPNLLTVYDYGEQPDFVYMVCPHQGGASLATLLAKQQMFTIEQALRVTEHFLRAILVLNEQGLLHQPIPLTDVYLKSDGVLVLSLVGIMDTALFRDGETSMQTRQPLLGQASGLLKQLLGQRAEAASSSSPRQIAARVEALTLRMRGAVVTQASLTIADCLSELQELQALLRAWEPLVSEPDYETTRVSTGQGHLVFSGDLASQRTLDDEEFVKTLIKVPATADGTSPFVRRLLLYCLAGVLVIGSVGGYLLFIRPVRPHSSTQTSLNGLGSVAQTQAATTALATCPPSGQVRTFVKSSLPTGHGESLVYLTTANGVQKLERYNRTTGQTTEILQASSTTALTHIQLSQDGQWIFFTKQATSTEFQVVRIDGQDLQTLYCSLPQLSIQVVEISPNLRYIVFKENEPALFLLDTQLGKLAPALSSTSASLDPVFWLNDTQLYLTTTPVIAADPRTLSLFDTRNGMSQNSQNLLQVLTFNSFTVAGPLNTIGGSADGSQIFYTSVNPNGFATPNGPTDLNMKPASGGTSQQLFSLSSPTGDPLSSIYEVVTTITDFQFVPPNSVLLLLNSPPGQGIAPPPVTLAVASIQQLAQQGVSGIDQIFADASLNSFAFGNTTARGVAAPSWTNVSRDGKNFVLLESVYQANGNSNDALVLGSMGGPQKQTLLVIATGPPQSLTVIGWTTFP